MKNTFTLKTFLILTLAGGAAGLLLLLLIPVDPKNAWVLGFSKSRIIMLVGQTLIVGLFALLTQSVLKDDTRYARISQRIRKTFDWSGNLTTGLVLSVAGFLGGGYFLFTAITTTDLFLQGYFIRLAPWLLWLTMICGQSLLFLYFSNTDRTQTYFQEHGVAILVLLGILTSGLFFHSSLWDRTPEDWDVNKMFNLDNKFDLEQQDIFQVFTEGDRLQHGENPYARALARGGDLQRNQQNATYLPVFYILTWLTQEAGLEDYLQFLSFWRVFFLIFNLAIAYLLFYIGYHRQKSLLLASFGALLWLFNRWTVHLTMIYHIDFIAIFFFLWSLALYPRHRIPSFLAFGLSLGVKQMAIFMIPIYLAWAWQSNKEKSIKLFVLDALVIGSIPLLVSLPFLIWNAEGFITSVLISATRIAESHFGVPSADLLLGLTGIPAKIPMLGMMIIIYALVWKGRINPFVAALFIMVVFVEFNSVLFRQYMAWVVPLIPLSIGHTVIHRAQAVLSPSRSA